MQAESNVKPPEVEVVNLDGRDYLYIRTDFEEVTKDDEGKVWEYTERTCTVPHMDGLAESVAENMTAWKNYIDQLDEQAATDAAHAAAVAEATDNLPSTAEAVDDLAEGFAELVDIVIGGE